MQTITTRYAGPTNHRGSRVSARTTAGRRLVRAWDYQLSADGNHNRAAHELATQLRWKGVWVAGTLSNERSVYVCISAANSDTWFCVEKVI